MFRIALLALAFVLTGTGNGLSRPRSDGGNRQERLYRSVQQWDSVAGQWERLNASARLIKEGSETTLVIWNNWSEERINPLVRIVVGNRPEPFEEADGQRWRYAGTVSRAVGSTERRGTIEFSTIIAEMSSTIDLTVRTDAYTRRYRIDRKTPRKP